MSKWIRLYSDEDFTSGLAAALPASGTAVGARYYATDTQVWYSWNGTTWDQEGGGGSGTVDTSGTPVATDYARFTDANTIEGRDPAEVRTDLGLVIGTDVAAQSHVGSTDGHPVAVGAAPGPETAGLMSGADKTKLDGVEAGADVTDTANVTAAGALMDSEVNNLSGIKTLTVPDSTTISTFGATLVDDTDAATARTTLDAARAPISGAGAPGASTGNGYALGQIYVDTTGDVAYTLVDATTDTNVWSSDADGTGGGGGTARDRAVRVIGAGGLAADTAISTNSTGDTLLAYTDATDFVDNVEVYVNGQLVRNGASAAANFDVYPTTTPDFAFEFALVEGDVVQVLKGGGSSNTDASAIHDNVAGEIALVAEKVSPVSADLLLIEDSADSNNKKRVQIGNLPGGGGSVLLTTAHGWTAFLAGKYHGFTAFSNGGGGFNSGGMEELGGADIAGAIASITPSHVGIPIPAAATIDRVRIAGWSSSGTATATAWVYRISADHTTTRQNLTGATGVSFACSSTAWTPADLTPASTSLSQDDEIGIIVLTDEAVSFQVRVTWELTITG